jgi:hypothetical protein
MTDRTDEGIARSLLRRRLNTIAERLRLAADRVDEHATWLDDVGQRVGSRSSYAYAISDVQADLVSMLANLQLGDLTVTAADADQARIACEYGREA